MKKLMLSAGKNGNCMKYWKILQNQDFGYYGYQNLSSIRFMTCTSLWFGFISYKSQNKIKWGYVLCMHTFLIFC